MADRYTSDEGMQRSGEVGIECTAKISWHGEEKLCVEDGDKVGS
jgi:hypothetical protein